MPALGAQASLLLSRLRAGHQNSRQGCLRSQERKSKTSRLAFSDPKLWSRSTAQALLEAESSRPFSAKWDVPRELRSFRRLSRACRLKWAHP